MYFIISLVTSLKVMFCGWLLITNEKALLVMKIRQNDFSYLNNNDGKADAVFTEGSTGKALL